MRPPRPGSLGYNAIAGTAGATIGASSGAALSAIGANSIGSSISSASNNAVRRISIQRPLV